MLKALLPGDIVVVTKLDRVARSARDLLNIVGELKDRDCGFISLGDSWCDTTNEMGRFMLAVMSGIAALERDLIRKRCQAGIERAKAKGTKSDRPSALDASQRRKIAERYAAGETMAELAREYECVDATIWRALHPSPELQAGGARSLRAIAAGLEERGIPAARGGKWSAVQVMRLLEVAAVPFGGSQGVSGGIAASQHRGANCAGETDADGSRHAGVPRKPPILITRLAVSDGRPAMSSRRGSTSR